jgi:hypothetical protein
MMERPIEPPPMHLHARAVPWRHALAWYEDGLALWRRAPAVWIVLTVLLVAVEFSFALLPEPWTLIGVAVTPLVGGGLVYAAAAIDRGARPSPALALRAFRASAGAVVAVVAANALSWLLSSLALWWLTGEPPLGGTRAGAATVAEALAAMVLSVLATLPFAFVPYHALLEGAGPGAALRASWQAFVLNPLPLAVFTAAAMVLLALGMLTFLLGLAFALPAIAAASYLAWKDIFGVGAAPTPP